MDQGCFCCTTRTGNFGRPSSCTALRGYSLVRTEMLTGSWHRLKLREAEQEKGIKQQQTGWPRPCPVLTRRSRHGNFTCIMFPAFVGVTSKHVVPNPDQRHCRAFVVASGVEITGTVEVFRRPEAQLPLFPDHLHRLQVLGQFDFDFRMTLKDLRAREIGLFQN